MVNFAAKRTATIRVIWTWGLVSWWEFWGLSRRPSQGVQQFRDSVTSYPLSGSGALCFQRWKSAVLTHTEWKISIRRLEMARRFWVISRIFRRYQRLEKSANFQKLSGTRDYSISGLRKVPHCLFKRHIVLALRCLSNFLGIRLISVNDKICTIRYPPPSFLFFCSFHSIGRQGFPQKRYASLFIPLYRNSFVLDLASSIAGADFTIYDDGENRETGEGWESARCRFGLTLTSVLLSVCI